MIEKAKTCEERFWSKVERLGDGDCWRWMASSDGHYGHFWEKSKGRLVKAHRFAWESINGKIPSDKIICHKCDNPICVNPNHLFLGTYTDNARDMVSKGRCRNGGTIPPDRKSTRLNSSHVSESRMPSSA